MDFGDPRSAMVSIFDALSDLSLPLSVFGWPVLWVWQMSVPGTRRRYVLATIVPVVILVNVFGWSCTLVVDALRGEDWWAYPLDAIGIAGWVWAWGVWQRGRDDDFWKGLGGRIRSRMRRRARRFVPVAAPR